MKRFIFVVFVACMVACTPKEIIKPHYIIPQRPKLTTVAAEELVCLSKDTFDRLLRREQQRRKYAEDLEVIVKECAK